MAAPSEMDGNVAPELCFTRASPIRLGIPRRLEQQNLTIRTQIRRLTRLMNVFGTRWENLKAVL